MPPSIGNRIHIVGSSCSGKTTLAQQLSRALDMPAVDLDALNWEPNWYALSANEPERFTRRIIKATQGDRWVVAGSYSRFSQPILWHRLETVVWLDMPLPLLVRRVLVRSWRRWRSKELLWGTNYERFWPQLAIWRKEESLLWWIVTKYNQRRQNMLDHMQNPRWQHITFIHLQGPKAVAAWLKNVEAEAGESGRAAQ